MAATTPRTMAPPTAIPIIAPKGNEFVFETDADDDEFVCNMPLDPLEPPPQED